VACGYLTGGVVSVAGRDGRGALGVHWPGWVVASQCSVQACAVSGFLEGRECPEVRRRTRRSSSHVGTQVFDREGSVVMGERESGCATGVLGWCGARVRERE
jgi:hypothetical protein